MPVQPTLPIAADLISIKYLVRYPVLPNLLYGWAVPRQGRVTDCVPTFTNPTAMVGASSLGTFEQALKVTIRVQENNIEVAQILLAEAKADLLAVQTRGGADD